MGYVYAVIWLIIAVMLFLRFRKENKVVYLLSLYFVFLSVWWFLDEFIAGLNLLDGSYTWLLRIVSAVVLVISAIVYILDRKNHITANNEQTQDKPTDA